MSAGQHAAGDLFASLSGHDEVEIRKEFREDVYRLAKEGPATFTRALIYVAERRDGHSVGIAYGTAMNLPQAEVTDYFTDEAEEVGVDLGEPSGETTTP